MSLFDTVSSKIGDDDNLDALSGDLGEDVVGVLLTRAEETLETGLSDIKEALESRDSVKIREVAHSLKGASGSLYALKFSDMAAQIEKKCEEVDVIAAAMPEFEKSASQTLVWWKSKLG